MKRLGVLVNANAGRGRDVQGSVDELLRVLGDRGRVVATHSLSELDAALDGFEAEGLDLLAVLGGDGTYYHLLGRLLSDSGRWPVPTLLPLGGGTINNLCRSLGVSRRAPRALLKRALKTLGEQGPGRVEKLVTMRINGDTHGFTVGAGMAPNFLELYYQARSPGPASALLLLARLFFSNLASGPLIDEVNRGFEASIEANGLDLGRHDYNLLLASTISHVGMGVRPFWRANGGENAVHLLAGNETPGALLLRLHRFLLGLPSGMELMYDAAFDRLRVEFPTPQPLMINGELLAPASELLIETGPTVACMVV